MKGEQKTRKLEDQQSSRYNIQIKGLLEEKGGEGEEHKKKIKTCSFQIEKAAQSVLRKTNENGPTLRHFMSKLLLWDRKDTPNFQKQKIGHG